MTGKRLEELRKFLEEDPDDPFLKYALALEMIAMDQHEQACNELHALLEKHPDYLPAYYIVAKESLHLNQRETATSLLQQGIVLAKKLNNKHTLAELMGLLDELED